MTQNQKLIALCIALTLAFFFLTWGWIIFIGAILTLIFFRDPLWDFAQATAKAIFPAKKPKQPPTEPPVPPVLPTP